jgi:hypothetical protein
MSEVSLTFFPTVADLHPYDKEDIESITNEAYLERKKDAIIHSHDHRINKQRLMD